MSYWKIVLGAIFWGPGFNSTSLERINRNERNMIKKKREREQKSSET